MEIVLRKSVGNDDGNELKIKLIKNQQFAGFLFESKPFLIKIQMLLISNLTTPLGNIKNNTKEILWNII